MDNIKIFVKNKKEQENAYVNSMNIQPEYKNGSWDWKMCQKSWKIETELQNQESIRTLWEKDNHLCNILTNKREITSDATGVTAPTTSGGLVKKEYTRHSRRCSSSLCL